MARSTRFPHVGLLALALALTSSACNRDEGALITPISGNWTSAVTEEVNDSCPAEYALQPTLSSFLLDYDAGDSFQIEFGQNDIVCDIDGVDYVCPDYQLSTFDVGGFAATVVWDLRFEGTFDSESRATGLEQIEVTCQGEDCNLLQTLPCLQQRRFEWNSNG